jgi:hypothetical protein
MNRLQNPGRLGWLGLFGGLLLGAFLVVVFLRVVAVDDGWMALVPVAVTVGLAGIPYRPEAREGASLAPWRYFVLAMGIALCVGVPASWLIQP